MSRVQSSQFHSPWDSVSCLYYVWEEDTEYTGGHILCMFAARTPYWVSVNGPLARPQQRPAKATQQESVMGPENLSRSRPENDHVHQLTNRGIDGSTRP